MKTHVHTEGELSVSGTAETFSEYVKRIDDWELIHESGYPGNKKQGERWVVLDMDGTMTRTEGLNDWLQSVAQKSVSRVRFLIGGKEGIDSSYRTKADLELSLGPMVMNQCVAAVVLAEQLYRCFAIRTRHPYH
ncbi:MAG: 23S rRNA (pseudouridine(1915)-N(3))-methyltransferase RlmH [bacterium]